MEIDMSAQPVSKPDDLIRSKIKDGAIELTEHELSQVSGGDDSSGSFLTLDGIKGESIQKDHKAFIIKGS
jgi:bacteriocin-like protein